MSKPKEAIFCGYLTAVPIFSPSQVSSSEPAVCRKILASAEAGRFDWSRVTVSSENPESVVRLPKKPVNQQQLPLRMADGFGKDADEQRARPVGKQVACGGRQRCGDGEVEQPTRRCAEYCTDGKGEDVGKHGFVCLCRLKATAICRARTSDSGCRRKC